MFDDEAFLKRAGAAMPKQIARSVADQWHLQCIVASDVRAAMQGGEDARRPHIHRML